MIRLVGNALLLISAAQALEFMVAYHLSTDGDWRRSAAGWHLMAFMAAMALVLVLAAVRIVFGDAPWFQALRALTFVVIPIVLGWRRWLLWRVQRRGRQ